MALKGEFALEAGRSQVVHLKKASRRGALLLAGLIGALAIALAQWSAIFPNIGSSIVDSQTPRPADLILVVGGDFFGPRVFKAAELAVLGYSQTVLISSPPYHGRPEGEFAIDLLASQGYPRQLFSVFAHNAASTIDEAIALRGELTRRGVNQVILVTSTYHSRRTAIVFRLFCPGIRFISVPAADPHYQPDRWWSDKSFRRLFFSEWSKILGSVLVVYPRYLLSFPAF